MKEQTALPAADVRAIWDGPIVDADVHLTASVEDLLPYLESHWVDFIRERGYAKLGQPQGVRRTYPDGPAAVMPRWSEPGSEHPGSTVAGLRAQLLDHLDCDYAIANCYFAPDSIRHPDFAVAITRAVNDWLIDEWLSADRRLRASMVLPPRDPRAMIAEIERVGGHPGFVQALVPVHGSHLHGWRMWHPVWEQLAENDLVLGMHFGGTGDSPPTSTGYPNHYFTEYVAEPALFWAQITSLIAEGVFQEVPDLRVSILEAGFTWLPSLVWRLLKEWKGLRRDIPWVDVPPTDTIREHFRFSTAPLDCADATDVEAFIRWLDAEQLLLFATDYPHWHEDDIRMLLDGVPEDARERVMAKNAIEWYRLPS